MLQSPKDLGAQIEQQQRKMSDKHSMETIDARQFILTRILSTCLQSFITQGQYGRDRSGLRTPCRILVCDTSTVHRIRLGTWCTIYNELEHQRLIYRLLAQRALLLHERLIRR